ncbi:MAG: family protein YvdD [Bacteroidetes bacterium]|nr:family protein YvdD [Bacteroidota bacterium]
MKLESIALFCGSSEGNDPKYVSLAEAFGKACAEKNLSLYYGGAALGLMKAAAHSCRNEGGRIIGITPSFFSDGTVVDNSLQELYLVDTMSERKQLLERSADAFVILPGSYGTMDEFFEVLTDAQLGLHHKPIAILNVFGYYDHLIALIKHFETEGFLRDFHHKLVIIADSVEQLFQKLDQYENPNNFHWLDKIKK